MKKSFIQTLAVAFVAALALTASVQAEPEKKKPEAAAEKKAEDPNGIPFRGKLTAVDTTAKTITVGGKEKDRTFSVTSETRIKKDGKPATLADAKVGDEVGGYGTKDGDKVTLKSLRIGPKPEGKGDDKGKEHKKK